MSQVLPKDVPQTLRRWKRYPAYKNSGVEWLGEIPKDWRVLTVRNLIRSEYLEIQDGNHGEMHPRAEDYVEMGIPFVMANNIRNGKIDLEGCKYISEQQSKSLRIGFSESGDVLLTHKGTIGETAIVPEIIKFEFIMLTPQVTYYRLKKHEINRDFLFCYFQSKSFQERLKFIASNQSTRDYVGLVAQKDFEIVLPSPNEQNAIASFLDRETAKIDALIAKKERLIELLQEKRTAIISHTVTKGLNSTAPLKDSGVEWLGEIPEDWRVVTVRNLIRSECLEIQDGNHGKIHPRAEDYVEMGIPFLMANNIRNGKIDLEGCKYISEQQAESLRIGFSQSGDVLLTHKGTLGETSIIPHNIKFRFVMLTPQVTYYRIKKQEIDKMFLYYYFQSKPFQERLKFIAGNQSTRDYVGLIAQKNFEIVLPYPYEQKVIASYLDRETAKIDALIAKIREGIEKLKEYRTALISAAVTGKIDVRNEVAS
ncbi:restriction endonuclease subunit S [Coleofasciculus sp. FACHB-64]|uniref:restriction endonuclease subunit S n=1 Tax=Cyanophyceae TaxID=3028117 RepID=UPI001686E432|nr:restriction endonuclease subunit S [Coleofasciculus sp. FACHB-64]MBD2047287.1 restriction endonuclease subunit S [Coleofasciculus sp. FACHB-64]